MRTRLADRAAALLESREDRRRFLRRTAMAGSALATVPTTFVLRPGTAYAAMCANPAALCNDGYTEFCCTIYGANRCPTGSLLGGWWKVDGSSFCAGGPRYYMDCHGRCGTCSCGSNGVCSGSCNGTRCGCALGDCNNRKAGCTNFRYGQCNQQIRCVGPIICRVVTCTPPWQLDATCSTAVRTDNRTAYHHRPCLEEHPVGRLEVVRAAPAAIRVRGWAFDPSTTGSISVQVTSNMQPMGTIVANIARPEVGTAYRRSDRVGFDAWFPAKTGEHCITVTALNVGAGANRSLGVRSVTVDANPKGSLELVQAVAGGVRVRGWAADPDTPTAPIDVTITANGRRVRTIRASLVRSDIGRTYPALGSPHGFDEVVPLGNGTHEVCVIARNVGAGRDLLVGCRKVTVIGDPRGALETVVGEPGGLRVTGWAWDRDATGPTNVQIRLDGVLVATTPANLERPEVAAANPGAPAATGFDITIPADPGDHEVCATAVNQATGRNIALGCRSGTAGEPEVGMEGLSVRVRIDTVTGTADGVHVVGTFVDPDDPGAVLGAVILIDGHRHPVEPGPDGRLDVVVPAEPGEHEVHVLAVNQLGGWMVPWVAEQRVLVGGVEP